MIDFDVLKKSFSTNLPTLIVIGAVWFNLNSKMTDMLLTSTSYSIKVDKLEERMKKTEDETSQNTKNISQMENKFYGYIGDAYLREKKEDIESEDL